MTRLGLAWSVACAMAIVAVSAWSREPPGGRAGVDTVRVVPQEYRARLAELVVERDGLRARLRGLEQRTPATVYLTDSVLVTDTVLVVVNERGRLTYQLATGFDHPAPAELRTGIDVSGCDDGFQIRDQEVICDRPRLGHLYVGPVLSRSPALAAWWQPSYRSPWLAEISYDGAWNVGVRRGVRLW